MVTLCAVTSVALLQTVAALKRCMAQAEFGAVKLFTDDRSSQILNDGIEPIHIARLSSREAYSDFVLRCLADHVQTDHVLIVQWDSFILDSRRWLPEFLDYDYVGAIWPQFNDAFCVGNGGFSLRSRRLLNAAAMLGPAGDISEDIWLCRINRPRLEAEFGVRFAPKELASYFSFERTARQGYEFGFHGAFHLPEILGLEEFSVLYKNIDAVLIHRKDHKALARAMIARFVDKHARDILMTYLKHLWQRSSRWIGG